METYQLWKLRSLTKDSADLSRGFSWEEKRGELIWLSLATKLWFITHSRRVHCAVRDRVFSCFLFFRFTLNIVCASLMHLSVCGSHSKQRPGWRWLSSSFLFCLSACLFAWREHFSRRVRQTQQPTPRDRSILRRWKTWSSLNLISSNWEQPLGCLITFTVHRPPCSGFTSLSCCHTDTLTDYTSLKRKPVHFFFLLLLLLLLPTVVVSSLFVLLLVFANADINE